MMLALAPWASQQQIEAIKVAGVKVIRPGQNSKAHAVNACS
jgi:hypothetical protein